MISVIEAENDSWSLSKRKKDISDFFINSWKIINI
jgi:hypothetical protein